MFLRPPPVFAEQQSQGFTARVSLPFSLHVGLLLGEL
jgi:hypothetical protein